MQNEDFLSDNNDDDDDDDNNNNDNSNDNNHHYNYDKDNCKKEKINSKILNTGLSNLTMTWVKTKAYGSSAPVIPSFHWSGHSFYFFTNK